jgi:hypothetical protein
MATRAEKKAAAAAAAVAASAEPVHVYPDPAAYASGNYLAGVPLEGTEVPAELAAEWLGAGLVTLDPPPAAPAQPEA